KIITILNHILKRYLSTSMAIRPLNKTQTESKSYFFLTILFSFLIISCSTDDTNSSTEENYQDIVLNDDPVGFWPLDYNDGKDLTKNKADGKFKGNIEGISKAKLPNGDEVNIFNGTDNHFKIPPADHLKLIN